MNLNCANDVSGNKSECTHVHVQHTLSAKLGVGERVGPLRIQSMLFNQRWIKVWRYWASPLKHLIKHAGHY